MRAEQLELELWNQLQRAQQSPDLMNVESMLDAVEAMVAHLPESEQLRFAGEALLQVAELCAARSALWMMEWEETSRDPVVEQGFFAEVVRQTMAVDLSELMEPRPARKQRMKSTQKPEGSIVAPVDKAAVLAMVDHLEAADEAGRNQEVWAIAHEEKVSYWTEAIEQRLQDTPDERISFTELCCYLSLPWVEVWLGLLLGGFELEQRGEFYQAAIGVRCLMAGGVGGES
ncbi:MAG TPA: hypothetical protein V6C84_12510 [Coleofasciculaceae cyanobacterium]|jgi:chromatin segregation and condensation protein Rec8/ScpA/Scc1 (kleisin family)